MGYVFINESTLTNIGNAIRAKTGGTDLIAPGDMAGAVNEISNAGDYLWKRKGMSGTAAETTSSSTVTLTTANTVLPSCELEYSSSQPTYDSTKKTWIFPNSTKVTLTNSDTYIPSISGNVYARVLSVPNVWYLVSAFNYGGVGPYTKNMSYSKKYTESAGDVIGGAVSNTSNKYPDNDWYRDGYFYEKKTS